ncbi:MAG: ATP-dependent protease LonB [Firmicutes bacterium]|jgi:Lon-like ATP-dependent protease|nr:ATP-dependent protease LonB [Bacillota bacterium]
MMGILGLINLFFAIVIGLYFWNLWRQQQSSRSAVDRESRKELEKLNRLKAVSLTEPLAERTRPQEMAEIIGQDDGLKALRAALCGPNPQHVIIYGPPGVGKTAAARVVLEEAKRNPLSPFAADAKFVEIDATTARFDDRGIADPLMGSVHDPIYQGAGPLGIAGIPQPKPGAVTKAHGGILFIDEIGELHPIQMNKLLKVLEDRKVFLESAYYSSEDTNIPAHIHEIFQKGLPADFRLVGATTRMPHELPPALRSRCLEVFFRVLTPDEIGVIARHAAEKIGFPLTPQALSELQRYAANGRDAVNMVQIAAGICQTEGRKEITKADIEWVVNSGQYAPRMERRIPSEPAVGLVNGLAVYGPNMGMLINAEAAAIPVEQGRGTIKVTGVMDEEEIGGIGRTMRGRSQARNSVDNVITVLKSTLGLRPQDYDIHVNFPGGVPIDGPSAGVTMVTAIYSAIASKLVDNTVAMTGEVTIHGQVQAVGGIVPKVNAAREAGVKRVLIPADNWQELFAKLDDIEVVPIRHVSEALRLAVVESRDHLLPVANQRPPAGLLSASNAHLTP